MKFTNNIKRTVITGCFLLISLGSINSLASEISIINNSSYDFTVRTGADLHRARLVSRLVAYLSSGVTMTSESGTQSVLRTPNATGTILFSPSMKRRMEILAEAHSNGEKVVAHVSSAAAQAKEGARRLGDLREAVAQTTAHVASGELVEAQRKGQDTVMAVSAKVSAAHHTAEELASSSKSLARSVRSFVSQRCKYNSTGCIPVFVIEDDEEQGFFVSQTARSLVAHSAVACAVDDEDGDAS